MFGNLKNKLGEVTDLKKYASPQIPSSLTGSRQRSAQHTPGSQTPSLSGHSRQESLASLPEIGMPSSSNSQQGLSTSPNNVDKTVPYAPAQANSILEKEITKLRYALEVQQDAALLRLTAKEQEWRLELEEEKQKNSMLDYELRKLKEQETLLNKKLKNIDKSYSIEDILKRNKELEKNLYELQENYDQLESLSTQEVAKVKHLLLNTSSELEISKSTLHGAEREVEILKTQVVSLASMEERLHIIADEKTELETKVAGLSKKLESSSTRLSSQSSEHEDEIIHLREKISTLEGRINLCTLEETDRIHEVVKERNILEHKLEEARQQLNNVKISWSEKISHLEGQIQHLNGKMAEDQTDLSQSERLIVALEIKLKEAEENNLELNRDFVASKSQHTEQLNILQEELDSMKWQMDTENEKKDREIKDLRRNLNMEDIKNKQLKETMLSKEEEYSQTIKQKEKLESDFLSLKTDYDTLKENDSSLEASKQLLEDQLRQRRLSTEDANSHLKVTLERLETVTSERGKLSSNLDIYVDEVSGLKNEIDGLKVVVKEKEESIQNVGLEILRLKQEVEELKLDNADMRSGFDSKVEQSGLVLELREKIKGLEDEIGEKKQMLKVQSQRVADMKKTIQKELKLSSDFADTGLESNCVKGRNRSTSPPTLQLGPSQSIPRNIDNVTNSLSTSPNENSRLHSSNGMTEFDPVNLQYLKHVILKFVSSREYEAVQLTRAVATLLHMTPTEEELLRKTLEWKMAGLGRGNRPSLGEGQFSQTIPHS